MSHFYRSFLFCTLSILITFAAPASATVSADIASVVDQQPVRPATDRCRAQPSGSETDGEIEFEPEGFALASETDGEIEVEPEGFAADVSDPATEPARC